MNNLKIMFNKQKEFQKLLKHDTESLDYIKNQILCLYDEVGECLHCIPFKNWKKNQILDKKHLQEEVIDCMHFLINIAIYSGLDYEDFFQKFLYKNTKNFDRQQEGY